MKKLKRTLGLVSLGCAKNMADLEILTADMLRRGYVLANDPDNCDTLIVNTCAFIAPAREEAESEIARACRAKRLGMVGHVIVRGCYPERYPDRWTDFPEVDEWQGVPKTWSCRRVPGLRLTGPAFAYVKIAEGCAHRCAYCAIPNIRGKYRSRPVRDVLREVREFVRTGVKELNIIAQDPMLFGVDLPVVSGKKVNLVSLLRKIDQVPGDFKVRVLYSYPSEITDEFLAWLRDSPRACHYVDVPLQHTIPAVLRKMARGSAIKATLGAVERIRTALPQVTVRTTIMTGFPGETEKRFKRMLEDIKKMSFDHLGVFAYSPETGTPAARLAGRPSYQVAEARAQMVMAVQKRIWIKKARSLVGKTFKALVTAPGICRLESQAPDVDGVTRFMGDAPVGSFVQVKIERVRGFDFEARVVGDKINRG